MNYPESRKKIFGWIAKKIIRKNLLKVGSSLDKIPLLVVPPRSE